MLTFFSGYGIVLAILAGVSQFRKISGSFGETEI
jgi:hypothetical protein